MRTVRDAITIDDLQKLARRRLPNFIIDYAGRGAGSGACTRGNVDEFLNYHFSPKALAGTTPLNTKSSLLGRDYAQPFGISAVGVSGLYRRYGDEILAEAARDADIPFILSGSGTSSIETISKIAPDHTWYQLYPSSERKITDDFISRAEKASVEVLVITVDFPEPNQSEVKERTGVSVGRGPSLRTFPALFWDVIQHPLWLLEFLAAGGTPKLDSWRPYAPANANSTEIFEVFNKSWCGLFDWKEVERIRALWPGKLVIKGITSGEDVARAVAAGADAVTISNHGGNKLDRVLPSLRALHRICLEQKSEHGIPLFFDGGIRRGTDVLTALAVGADYCFLGRATLFGVAAGGSEGANRALSIISNEMSHAMAMIGCRSIDTLDRSFLA